MNEVMLDLETMGQGPDAAIVAIGAVAFDPVTHWIGDPFYRVVDLESAVATGGKIDPSTVMWWLQQGDTARQALTTQAGEHLPVALIDFGTWCARHGSPDKLQVWGNGAAFDNVILRGAYERAGIAVPWRWWNDRCYRTLKCLHRGIELERTGTAHNALDDAESQARHLCRILTARGSIAAVTTSPGGSY